MTTRSQPDRPPFPQAVRVYLAVLAEQADRSTQLGAGHAARLAHDLRSMDTDRAVEFVRAMARALDPGSLFDLPTSV